jgi:hypothetical protein
MVAMGWLGDAGRPFGVTRATIAIVPSNRLLDHLPVVAAKGHNDKDEGRSTKDQEKVRENEEESGG